MAEKIIPADDTQSGLQRIKDDPNREEALARLCQQYIPVGERRLDEAKRYRFDLVRELRAKGVGWKRLTELTGLSEQHMRKETANERE